MVGSGGLPFQAEEEILPQLDKIGGKLRILQKAYRSLEDGGCGGEISVLDPRSHKMSMHLVIFFTRGVSLRTWAMMGMLAREIAIYRRFIADGFRVSFVTYGDARDLDYSEQLGGIEILCNDRDLPLEEYESRLFSLHESSLRGCSA